MTDKTRGQRFAERFLKASEPQEKACNFSRAGTTWHPGGDDTGPPPPSPLPPLPPCSDGQQRAPPYTPSSTAVSSVTLASVSLCPRGSPLHGLLGNSRPTRTRRRALQRPASTNCLAPLNLLSPASRLIAVLAPAAQTVKPRTYTGDERRPCARTARKFVKRSLRFDIYTLRASLVAQLVKNLPAMPETWV